MTLFTGIDRRIVQTEDARAEVLLRASDERLAPERTVVLVSGDASSEELWQDTMVDLPADLRVIAVDLPEEGSVAGLAAALAELRIPAAHLVGSGQGAEVVARSAQEHPALTLTLESPSGLPDLPSSVAPRVLWIHAAGDDGENRALLDAYAAAGGNLTEAAIAESALPHRDHPDDFRRELLHLIRYTPIAPLPTEAIILRSED